MRRLITILCCICLCVAMIPFNSCRKPLEEELDYQGYTLCINRGEWNGEEFPPLDTYYIKKYHGTDRFVALPEKAPNGAKITAVAQWAFVRNSSIQSIAIPDSYEEMDNNAFCELESLKSVYIGKGMRKISPFENFSMCKNLETIEVSKENPIYYSENHCIIERESKTLILGSNTAVIPEDIQRIGTCAFYGRESLKEIQIPKSVTVIEDWAFFGCSSLQNIMLHDTVEMVHNLAFVNCPSLTIYCEALEKPAAWSEIWCKTSPTAVNQYPSPTVVWGAEKS